MNIAGIKNKSLFLLLALVVGLFLIFLFLVFNIFTRTPSVPNDAYKPDEPYKPSSSESIYHGPNGEKAYYDPKSIPLEEVKKTIEDARHTDPPLDKKEHEISDLVDKLPYSGTFFSLRYGDNGFFIVNFDPANINEGNEEFNKFLIQNGIPDRSYLTDLQTTTSSTH